MMHMLTSPNDLAKKDTLKRVKRKERSKNGKEKKMGDGDVSHPIEVIDIENDVLYPSISCRGSNIKDPISVEQYTEDKELHQAVMASILDTKPIIDLLEEDEVEEIKLTRTFGFVKTPFMGLSVTENGESSNSKASTFICEICAEPKSQSESFNIMGCTHYYCSECMVQYIASKIQENITVIPCPESNCKGLLEPELCRSILPPEVFDRWGNALCESLILGSEKFYCPFKDCSALLIDDGGEAVKESECPNCRRLFCAQCKVPWHAEISCEEFQKLNENERGREDVMVMQLAKKNKWQRCPKCMFYIERSEGCLFMKCRCGFTFCYNCGAEMSPRYHYCDKCRR